MTLVAQEQISPVEYIIKNEPKVYKEIIYFANKTRVERYSDTWFYALKLQANAYFEVQFLLEMKFSNNNEKYKKFLFDALKNSMEIVNEEAYINYLLAIDLFEYTSGLKVKEL